MSVETEVKIHVPDRASIEAKLESIGAQLVSGRVFERNIRYDTAGGDLSERDVVLRLRQDERVRVTYKEAADPHDTLMRRTELETTVGDFDTFNAILNKLGYVTAMEYEKYRSTYHWGEVEIVLDEMPYGVFMEIEGEEAAIEAALEALHLRWEKRWLTSYVALFSQMKAALGLTFRDLTFANFEGVQIPARFWEESA